MSGVDRAALIEAAADKLINYGGERIDRFGLAERALDAVLPLVAQAIEANELPFYVQQILSASGDRCAADMRASDAALVRSLAEEGQQQ